MSTILIADGAAFMRVRWRTRRLYLLNPRNAYESHISFRRRRVPPTS